MSKGKYTRDQIAARCNQLHNNKYKYAKLPEYPKMHDRVDIECPHHGYFTQRLNDHINRKAGCPACSGNKRGILGSDIIKQVAEIWGDDYVPNVDPATTYVRTVKVEVVCKIHGAREVLLNNLLSHQAGCLQCQQQKSSRRLDADVATVVYLVKLDGCYKIGITSNLESRMRALQQSTKSIPTILKTVEYSTRLQAFVHEQHSLSMTVSMQCGKFPGHTELFTADSDEEAIAILDAGKTEYPRCIELSPKHCSGYTYVRNLKNSNLDMKLFYTHEVLEHPEIVADMLSNSKRTIHARACKLVFPTAQEAALFMNQNHLQGNVNASHILGLQFNGELVSVMTFGVPRFNKDYSWELLRLATVNGVRVVGGASKLLTAFRRKYNGSIISYCDRRYSLGGVYHAIGFEYLKTTAPGFSYTNGEVVLSRWKAQKQNLKSWFTDYDDTQSQAENMLRAGFTKMYDAGQMVFQIT